MNVILLDKVENLGDIGDLVTVKPGQQVQVKYQLKKL